MSYRSNLPEISRDLNRQVGQALKDGADIVRDLAKVKCPIGPHMHHLKDSIRTESQPEGVYVIAGDYEAYYARFVEFGTVKMHAQPFLVPALEESQVRIVTLATLGLDEAAHAGSQL